MHKFNPDHIARLLRKDRFDEIRPEEVLRAAGLKEGDTFFDVGCGPGFFTLPGARVVGGKGSVYAIDTEPKMLDALCKRRPPRNVIPLKSGENRVPAPVSTADFILIAYVFHETADQKRFLMEMKRLLKDGAKLLIIDWKKKREEHGPPAEERLTAGEVKALLKACGFKGIRSATLTPSHYTVTAINVKRS